MDARARTAALGLALAMLASGWLPPFQGPTAHARPHCSSTGEHAQVGSARHEMPATVANRGPHECSHCPADHCSTTDHCTAGSPQALAAGALELDIPTAVAPPALWVSDRPLSGNPTPPIPPPQLVL